MIDIFVPGDPAPQGSKRHIGHGSMIESSKAVKPWRSDIRSMLLDAGGHPIATFDGAVACTLAFVMPRPKTAPKRHTPPATKRPDLDKLGRAVGDAIASAGVIPDDSIITELTMSKRLAEIGEPSGVRIQLKRIDFNDH